eukprot:g480.t1
MKKKESTSRVTTESTTESVKSSSKITTKPSTSINITNESFRNLTAGAIAGAVSRTVVSPLERLKIIYQTQATFSEKRKYTGLISSLAKMFREEGFINGFFRGNTVNVIRVIPYVGTQFLCFEEYKKLLFHFRGAGGGNNDDEGPKTAFSNLKTTDRQRNIHSGKSPPTTAKGSKSSTMNPSTTVLAPHEKFLIGSASGVTSVIVTYPLDLVRGRLTTQGAVSSTQYKGIFDCFYQILRKDGIPGLYKGMRPNLVGIIPYVGVNYLTYETIKENLPSDYASPIGYAIAGGVAGCTGQSVAYPFDLLRRRFQMEGTLQSGKYSGVTQAVSHIVKNEGIFALYNGFGPNFIKTWPTVMIMFTLVDTLKSSNVFNSLFGITVE